MCGACWVELQDYGFLVSDSLRYAISEASFDPPAPPAHPPSGNPPRTGVDPDLGLSTLLNIELPKSYSL